MVFTLSTTDATYEERQKKKLEHLGFRFLSFFLNYKDDKIFRIDSYHPTIEFNTLEEPLDFVKEYGEIVLFGDKDNCLEIYDNYRE